MHLYSLAVSSSALYSIAVSIGLDMCLIPLCSSPQHPQPYFFLFKALLIFRSIALCHRQKSASILICQPNPAQQTIHVLTHIAALFKGGSTAFTPFCMRGSILAAPLSNLGVVCAKPLFHLGPHFAACAASRSSAPGRKNRRGTAEAVTATPPTTPLERVKDRAAGRAGMFAGGIRSCRSLLSEEEKAQMVGNGDLAEHSR